MNDDPHVGPCLPTQQASLLTDFGLTSRDHFFDLREDFLGQLEDGGDHGFGFAGGTHADGGTCAQWFRNNQESGCKYKATLSSSPLTHSVTLPCLLYPLRSCTPLRPFVHSLTPELVGKRDSL